MTPVQNTATITPPQTMEQTHTFLPCQNTKVRLPNGTSHNKTPNTHCFTRSCSYLGRILATSRVTYLSHPAAVVMAIVVTVVMDTTKPTPKDKGLTPQNSKNSTMKQEGRISMFGPNTSPFVWRIF